MLINYNGQHSDVSTLAHELGHTMQSYYSNKTQPYPLAGYPIFVAEVASTFNESLLIDYMLGQIKDDDTRLSLLGNYLENIKGTVFRQTQFAEFELRMHEMAQKGEPITGDALAKLYLEITGSYYGHDQGDLRGRSTTSRTSGATSPHFYRDFYVFQYATSFTRFVGARREGQGGRSRSEEALPRVPVGAAARSIRSDLLKDAGVDMTTDEPLDLTISADEPDHGRDGEDPARRKRDSHDREEETAVSQRPPTILSRSRCFTVSLLQRVSSGWTRSTTPLQMIATPTHSRMNDDSRRNTAVPVSPR